MNSMRITIAEDELCLILSGLDELATYMSNQLCAELKSQYPEDYQATLEAFHQVSKLKKRLSNGTKPNRRPAS